MIHVIYTLGYPNIRPFPNRSDCSITGVTDKLVTRTFTLNYVSHLLIPSLLFFYDYVSAFLGPTVSGLTEHYISFEWSTVVSDLSTVYI